MHVGRRSHEPLTQWDCVKVKYLSLVHPRHVFDLSPIVAEIYEVHTRFAEVEELAVAAPPLLAPSVSPMVRMRMFGWRGWGAAGKRHWAVGRTLRTARKSSPCVRLEE